MPVVFIGNRQWQQVAEPEWTKMGWEISRATILYRGPRTGKTSFENTIFDFETMPGYQNMRLEQWQSRNQTPSFPGVEKMYVGFRNGIPPAKGTPSISSQTARVSGNDTATGKRVTATITYRASRTSWEWWETSTPGISPRHADVLNQNDPLKQIDTFQFETEDSVVPLSNLITVINAAVTEKIVSDYVCEPIIPNAIWRCSSVVDFRIRSS